MPPTITTDLSPPSTNPSSSSLLHRFANEIGIHSIWSSGLDTKLLCLQRFVRLFAYGTSTIILALFLASIGASDARIGLFMTLTLLGDVVISFLLTLVADGLGRRRILAIGALLMAASGVVFALTDNYWILVIASVFGVISPSGNEIGPFRAVEESTLAHLTPPAIRSDIFAWYTLLGAAGAACGTLTCGGLVSYMNSPGGMSDLAAYRVIFLIYAGLGLIKFTIALLMSKECEPSPPDYAPVPAELSPLNSPDREETADLLSSDSEEDEPSPITKVPSRQSQIPPEAPRRPFPLSLLPPLTTRTLRLLLPLTLLFTIDSFASGLIPPTWTSYYFTTAHHLLPTTLSFLFTSTSLLAALSHLVATSLSKRIGPLKTMVFTHLPSALFLAVIPLPPAPQFTWLAVVFLVARSALSSMDQAPRQAFLSGVVGGAERTAVMGVVNVFKTLGQSGGPVVTGHWVGEGKGGGWVGVFLLAGGLKAVYDFGILWGFLGMRNREEEGEREGRP